MAAMELLLARVGGKGLSHGVWRLGWPPNMGAAWANAWGRMRLWAWASPWRCQWHTPVQYRLQGSASGTMWEMGARHGWMPGVAAPGPRLGGAQPWPDMA